MTKYTATFADGTTITRKSNRTYAAAWRATWTDGGIARSDAGFCVSADKAAPFRPAPYSVSRFASANQNAEAKRKNAEFLAASGYRVEIVPTVAA